MLKLSTRTNYCLGSSNVEVHITDGGRSAAGFKGETGDCTVRAISIAAGLPYKEVYDGISALAASTRWASRRRARGQSTTARNGVPMRVVKAYLLAHGFCWVPTMEIGSGCKVHLRGEELPAGKLVVRLSKHLCAVIDGMIYDNHDPSRDGDRCVYGYFQEARA
jgi:hypothetical protein